MEASSSSNTANLFIESVVDNKTKIGSDSVGGRKSDDVVADLVEVSSDEVSSKELSLVDEEDYDSEEDSEEEDSDDEEEEEEDNERARIFQDLHNLKKLAGFFHHPEKAVEVDGFACGRSYFSRPEAAHTLSEDEEEELAEALADARALKGVATAYMHPERALEIDDTACARNYFSQPWAAEQDTFGHAEQRARLVGESQLLKELVVAYRHPEAPIDLEPATSMGRNYFMRASAPEQVDDEEQALILQEMQVLKKLAADYLHPEKSLEVDATAFGRNYFSCASAPEQEEDEYADEREIILEEMKELKQAAVDFMHPEKPVEMDSTGARSYFDRPSAADQDAEERELILQEMRALKKLAVDYRHPEKPLEVDATAFGRNYFTRASAPEQEEDEYSDDREIILEEMKELKQSAVDFMHPERPVEIDSTGARCYFDRASAELEEDAFEREMVVKDAVMMYQKAVDFMHPERPVSVDPAAFGRNYYGRPSAADQESLIESDEDEEERELILEEMEQLKKIACDYMHPEKPLSVDPAAFGRNYFGRASAATDESLEEAEERNRVLSEAASLKRLATSYAHPEEPVVATDASVFGRNYFSRMSAPEKESADEADERAQVIAEASALKKLAVDYLHPEVSVETTDPAAMGRNYFTRASAVGVSENISTSGHADVEYKADEMSHHDDYGHFEMDEEMFYDIRQSIVLPLGSEANVPKFQSSKMSSEEEGELSRSPSSVMLFTGALEDANHPPLPTMG